MILAAAIVKMRDFLTRDTDQLCGGELADLTAVPASIQQDILQSRALREALTREQLSKLHTAAVPENAKDKDKKGAADPAVPQVTTRDLVYYLLALQKEQNAAKIQAELECRTSTHTLPSPVISKTMVELHQLLKAQLQMYTDNVCLPALVLAPQACTPEVAPVEVVAPTTPKGAKKVEDEEPVEVVVQTQVEAVCDTGFCCVQWTHSDWAASADQKTMLFCVSNTVEGGDDGGKGGGKAGKGGKAPAKKAEDDPEAAAPCLQFDQGSLTVDAQEALSLCASFGKIRMTLEDAKSESTAAEHESEFKHAITLTEKLLNPMGVIHPSQLVQESRPVTTASSGKKSRPSTRGGKGDKKKTATEPSGDPNALLCQLSTVTFFERLLDSTSGVMMASGPECAWLRRTLSMRISELPQNNPLVAAACED